MKRGVGEGELSFRHEDSVQRKVYTKEGLYKGSSFDLSSFNYLLVSFGRPGPMETPSVLPLGFRAGTSEPPEEKFKERVPPPPQPSFFTVTVMLK